MKNEKWRNTYRMQQIETCKQFLRQTLETAWNKTWQKKDHQNKNNLKTKMYEENGKWKENENIWK